MTTPENYFIQTGWVDPAAQYTDICNGEGLAWFVTILFPGGTYGGPKLYNTGGCDLTGAHWFRMRLDHINTGYLGWRWTIELDGATIGPALYSNYGYVNRQNTNIFTEIVSPTPPPAGATYPAVEYGPALGVQLPDGFHDIAHSVFFHTDDGGCPPYHMGLIGSNDVQTYRSTSSSSCFYNGDQVW